MDMTLVVHIGLHKTGTTYIQNELLTRRHELLQQGVLYPLAGMPTDVLVSTRDGAQSGHAALTRTGKGHRQLVSQMIAEAPQSVSTVLLSSENFTLWHRDVTPEQQIRKFNDFGTVKVVLVLRRQDRWLESYYKQIVDGHADMETRSFPAFLEEEGPRLIDFHARFSPWRELVGPDNFTVLSYDDEPDATSICRKLLEVAGVQDGVADRVGTLDSPRYDSIRPIDTIGLRILNAHRLSSRRDRVEAARAIFAAAPDGDLTLLSDSIRHAIRDVCDPINERIEREWFEQPVPGLRFGDDEPAPSAPEPSGPEMVRYVDEVLSICRRYAGPPPVLEGDGSSASAAQGSAQASVQGSA
jgi:hypothetical protein